MSPFLGGTIVIVPVVREHASRPGESAESVRRAILHRR